MEAWIAGLLGTLVGAAGSVAGIWIQNHFQARRERLKLILEFAVQDRNDQLEFAKAAGVSGPVAPVALFAHYHGELFKLIDSGKMTEKALRKLYDNNAEVWAVIRDIDAKRKARGY
jgi:LPS O-antigen subunit length determinant protein (WzzB/FepE family)